MHDLLERLQRAERLGYPFPGFHSGLVFSRSFRAVALMLQQEEPQRVLLLQQGTSFVMKYSICKVDSNSGCADDRSY